MRWSLGQLALVALLLAPLLPMPGCTHGPKTTLVTNMKGKATRTDTVDLALSAGDALVFSGAFEGVKVRSTSRAPRVQAEITVIAYMQEEAETALGAFRMVTERTARGLEVKVVGHAGTYEIESGKQVPYKAFTTFTAIVPDHVRVIARSESGEVEVEGE